MVNGRWRAIASWLWPGHCVLCRAVIGAGDDLCAGCRTDLPWTTTACPSCAAPSASSRSACGACQRKRPAFDHAQAAFRYRAPVDRLIAGLKYHRRLDLARALGELLAEKLQRTARPKLVIPVPLHSSRLRERGYNQSLEVARVVAARLRVPLNADVARRTRATATQTALPLKQRARNVRNSFSVVAEAVAGKHVAVVDDVMTSGHTLNALAKALRRAGASKVSVWVVARA